MKLIIISLLLLLPLALANEVLPGSYAVALKYFSPSGYCARLGMYSFQAGGTFRSDQWEVCSNKFYGYGDGPNIGTSDQQGVPDADAGYDVRALYFFLSQGGGLQTLYGTWELDSVADVIEIRWSNGQAEYWKQTWSDDDLIKIEAYFFSGTANGYQWDFYLYNNNGSWVYNSAAANGGFGFGGSDCPGFEDTGFSSILDFENNFSGYVARWNNYQGQVTNQVYADELNLMTFFYPTDTGIKRYVFQDEGMWVFAYACLPDDRSGMFSRAVIYQIGHDFDHVDNIYNTPGHTYFGLQVIDAANKPRGFVFCDQTFDTGLQAVEIMSSMYYLDTDTTSSK